MKLHKAVEDELAYAKHMAEIGNICLMEAYIEKAKKDQACAKQIAELRKYGYEHAVDLHLKNAEMWARQAKAKTQAGAGTWMENNLNLALQYAKTAEIDIGKKVEEIQASVELR